MTPTGLLLGIDLGTSSVKALLLDPSGAAAGQESAPYAVEAPRPGWAESDPDSWWSAVAAAVRQAVAERGAHVAAIGLCGQMHGVVLADGGGRAVRPAVLWADRRSAADAAAWRALPEALRLRLANPIAPGMAGPILRWLAREEPDAVAAARWALQPKDWLRLRLTGEAAAEPSDASATLLWEPAAGRWSADVVDALGLPARLLPPVLDGGAGATAGRLTAAAAAHLGLPPDLPIAAGAADVAAAALGTGLLDPGASLLTVGTGAQVTVPLDRPDPDPRLVTHTYAAAAPGRWYAMAAVQNAGLAMEWALAALRADWAEAYASLDAVGPGAAGLVFVPYLTGERTPRLDDALTGAWDGLRLDHGRAHLLRAALEGVAFAIRDAAGALAAAGRDLGATRLAGGGSLHPAWHALLAGVLGRPLAPVRTPAASARGAALLAGVAAGVFHDVHDTLRVAEPPGQPLAAARAEAYGEPFRRYLAAALARGAG